MAVTSMLMIDCLCAFDSGPLCTSALFVAFALSLASLSLLGGNGCHGCSILVETLASVTLEYNSPSGFIRVGGKRTEITETDRGSRPDHNGGAAVKWPANTTVVSIES